MAVAAALMVVPFGLLFLLSGLIVNVVQAVCFITIRLFSKSLYRRINRVLAELLWLQLVWLVDWWAGVKIQVYADSKTFESMGVEHALVISNHRSDIDWLVGWILAQRSGCLGSALAVMKKSSKFLPVIGWSMWFAEYLFLERSWAKDETTLKLGLQRLKDFPRPFWLALFVEGTRFTPAKLLAAQEYAASQGLPTPRNVLIPRTKGHDIRSSRLPSSRLSLLPGGSKRLAILVKAMAVTFHNLNAASGLQKLNDYLLTRSYITGYQASKDDISVYSALATSPSADYVNVARWYNHIDALLKLCGISEEGKGVKIESSAPVVEEAPSPAIDDKKGPAADDDDDDDMDLFGEETEEEKKAAEERAAAVKASGKKKESGKSSVLLDVKPWDDETDMQKLEEVVRSVKMEGLLWGASKLAPVGYGIKKLQIMMTIVDDLVSVDNLIEDYLLVEPANEYIQSCDIVAFNKI